MNVRNNKSKRRETVSEVGLRYLRSRNEKRKQLNKSYGLEWKLST